MNWPTGSDDDAVMRYAAEAGRSEEAKRLCDRLETYELCLALLVLAFFVAAMLFSPFLGPWAAVPAVVLVFGGLIGCKSLEDHRMRILEQMAGVEVRK